MRIIRTFHPDDTAGVISLWKVCELTRPWNNPELDIQRKLSVNDDLFLVADDDGQIVGSIMGGYEGHRGWINYLAVDPSLQKQGLGRDLMDTVEARLLDKGCPKINLQVRTGNDAVIAFYEAIGYSNDECISFGKRLIPD
ncbi:GNAT family acetyltransferase [Granulosicoccus sp.]|nr:GNAT family acetyltransferase [Granulosicoccus sp.]MDB4222273.1 GNAT family acetyltransferase [Granulosicoccus sp.]